MLSVPKVHSVLPQPHVSSYSQGTTATQISNLNIKAFCQDSLGYMWIATPRGLNRYNGYEFLQYFHDPLDSNSINNDFVLSIFLDSSHRLWVGTSTGIDCYNFEANHFEHYPEEKNTSLYVYSFFEDHLKHIWVGTTLGPAIIDTARKKVILQTSADKKNVNLFWEDDSKKLWMGLNGEEGLAVQQNKDNWNYFSLPENRSVMCMYRDPQGIWWLGTNTGIILFDPALRIFKDPPKVLRNDTKLNRTQVNFIKEISPIKLLIGTASEGFFQYDILSQTLLHNEPGHLSAIHSTQLISCYVDRDHNIWIGSFDRGFKIWNNYLDYFNSDQHLSDIFKDKFVTRIVEDSCKNLWVSTRYHGLFNYTSSGKLTVYNIQNSDLFSNDNCLIESLFIDSYNRIWIGLTDQLIVAKISKEGRLQILSRKNLKQAVSIKEDLSGNLWIGSILGLYKIKKNDLTLLPELIYGGNVPDICILESDSIIFSSYGEGIYLIKPKEKNPLPFLSFPKNGAKITKHCITIYEDKQHSIWLGSYGNGVLYLSPDKKYSRVFDKRQGLPSNDVLCIKEDSSGNMWMSTSYGISKLRMADTAFVNYFSSDGTLGNQYHEKAGLKHSDGRIFFAGNNGLTFFNPIVILPIKYAPTVNLTDIKILNQSIQPASGSILTKSIPFTNKITLNHRQTVISIDYTGIDFLFSHKLTYAYQLEGFDKNWTFVGNYRRATYSNLAPGEYRFKVKAINGEVQESSPVTLKIIVKPAPWFSWQAYIGYLIVTASIIYLLFKLVLNIRMNRHKLEIEHSEREREREISEMKMNFFTNISHEIRTPLTLISAPLEQLSSLKTLDHKSESLLNTISRNVQSMLRLINQLLDFRKMENGMLNLQVQQTDAILFIRNILDIFIYPAIGKHVTLDFVPHVPILPIWIDLDKIEKILHNLLSNALKHTPEKGTVQIKTGELDRNEANRKYQIQNYYTYLEIIITDTGDGVPSNKLDELFLRYRQIDGPSGKKPDYSGSGIGLNYTKRLVETHYGKIQAKIRPEGGMIFSFIVPMGDIYTEYDKKEEKEITLDGMNQQTEETEKIEETKNKKYTILIAEDNVELMAFIRNLLTSQYELVEALDGTTAWSLVQSKSPDLILSDVLMPGLSGYELCRQVKQHPEFSHIPVILLTAKSTINDQLEGLEQGADVYICKPFHVEYLRLTIKNLFMSRDRLRQYYSTPQTPEQKVSPVILNIHDQKIMDKLTQILERELANPDLNINFIAQNLGFSRTVFYRKIKGLTDMSPIDFLRSYRLRRAAEMIVENSLSLNDIAINTGFNYYPYFSKSFKKHFGVSPKDYIQHSI